MPAASASCCTSSRPKAVTSTVAGATDSALLAPIRRLNSMPSMPGICQSVSTSL
jgi:hypothetical protein